MPTVDWSLKENSDRLLAAVWEAMPDRKLDYKRVSQLFGHGTTYNSIECRFRPVRKLGERLRNETTLAQNGSGDAQPIIPRKPRAPKRDKIKDDSILNGRINKSNSKSTPTRKQTTQPTTIKEEDLEEVILIPLNSDIVDVNHVSSKENNEPDISEIDAATIDQLSGLVDETDEQQTGAERSELQMGLYGM